MKQTIALIGNPIAGGAAARKIEKAAKIIKNRGFEIRSMLTEKKGDAESFAKEISRSKSQITDPRSLPLIIAAGGDGTYNEVINGIAGTDIPMAILPLGTTNVLAKELNISEDVDKAVDIALSGNSHKVCLGRITLSITRYFLLMAGIGYDGETVYRVNTKIKKYSGKGAYMWSGIKTLLSWNPDKLTFNIDGKVFEGYSAIICNASKYAGNFTAAPDAQLKEPSLYAFIMQGKRRSDMVRYVSGIIAKRHLKFSDITYLQAKNIEIKGNAHIQIDGDYLGKTPARIEIVPNALRLVY